MPTDPGVYVIAMDGMVIYVGKSWGGDGLRGRLSNFHRSATTGRKRHAGGVTFFGKYGAIDPATVTVSVHVAFVIRPEPEVLYPYIQYVERRLIALQPRPEGQIPAAHSAGKAPKQAITTVILANVLLKRGDARTIKPA